MIVGAIATIAGIVGIFGFYFGAVFLTAIGAVANIIETIVGLHTGELHSLFTFIAAVVIGFFVALFIHMPVWVGISLGLCFESTIMALASGALMLAMRGKAK